LEEPDEQPVKAQRCSPGDETDVYVINTCSVTEGAEARYRQAVG
jgi:tRNA A37 methylthiotransferase MiaB